MFGISARQPPAQRIVLQGKAAKRLDYHWGTEMYIDAGQCWSPILAGLGKLVCDPVHGLKL